MMGSRPGDAERQPTPLDVIETTLREFGWTADVAVVPLADSILAALDEAGYIIVRGSQITDPKDEVVVSRGALRAQEDLRFEVADAIGGHFSHYPERTWEAAADDVLERLANDLRPQVAPDEVVVKRAHIREAWISGDTIRPHPWPHGTVGSLASEHVGVISPWPPEAA